MKAKALKRKMNVKRHCDVIQFFFLLFVIWGIISITSDWAIENSSIEGKKKKSEKSYVKVKENKWGM